MKNDAQSRPRIAQSAVIVPGVIEFIGSPDDFSGLFVDHFGRLGITINGQGVRATFVNVDQMHATGHLLQAVAAKLQAEAALVAREAAGDLLRVVQDFAARPASAPAPATTEIG